MEFRARGPAGLAPLRLPSGRIRGPWVARCGCWWKPAPRAGRTSRAPPARTLPVVPEHQIVGRVEELGEGVGRELLGQRLGLGGLAAARGRCDLCRCSQENLCHRATFIGWDWYGGFAGQVLVRAAFAQPLPDDADSERLAPLSCGGVIRDRALRLTDPTRGEPLGAFSFGASELLVAQLAITEGCTVFVVSRSELARSRAHHLGAVWAVRPVPSRRSRCAQLSPTRRSARWW
ncbi:MAG: alcohol dehydrogenase catalytic domain-containing protein [Candidatus Dormiibacterota bacterium]